MAAVKVSVVALEHVYRCSGAIRVGLAAVGPARLPDSGVPSTAAQTPTYLANRAIPDPPAGAGPLVPQMRRVLALLSLLAYSAFSTLHPTTLRVIGYAPRGCKVPKHRSSTPRACIEFW
jgi:hypothetical protein